MSELASQAGGAAGSGGPLLQFAAALQPAPVVAPTAKKVLDLASSAHRQALKAKQDLERRQGHLDSRRSELRLQMEKVEADYGKCGEELAAAEAEVKAKLSELEQARTKHHATTTADPKQGKEDDQEAAKEKAMDVEMPVFDPVAFAKDFVANNFPEGPATNPDVAGDEGCNGKADETEGEAGTGGKKAKPDEEAADNPEAKKARMSNALAEGLSKGLAAQKAHYDNQIEQLRANMAGALASSFRVPPTQPEHRG